MKIIKIVYYTDYYWSWLFLFSVTDLVIGYWYTSEEEKTSSWLEVLPMLAVHYKCDCECVWF